MLEESQGGSGENLHIQINRLKLYIFAVCVRVRMCELVSVSVYMCRG